MDAKGLMDYGYSLIFRENKIYNKASAYIFATRKNLIRDLRFINGSF